jgi:hypothetical protein
LATLTEKEVSPLGNQQKLRQRELVWSGPTSGAAVRRLTLPAGGGLVDKRYRNSFFCIPT